MGIAALVLGIVSIIIGFIPFCGAIALVPAIVGLILGIVEIVKKKKTGEPKGMGIAGTILSGLAILIICAYVFVIGAAANIAVDGLEEFAEALNEIDLNEINVEY